MHSLLYCVCREVCLETIVKETPKLIGGAGLTVEIDESKFGKKNITAAD